MSFVFHFLCLCTQMIQGRGEFVKDVELINSTNGSPKKDKWYLLNKKIPVNSSILYC